MSTSLRTLAASTLLVATMAGWVGTASAAPVIDHLAIKNASPSTIDLPVASTTTIIFARQGYGNQQCHYPAVRLCFSKKGETSSTHRLSQKALCLDRGLAGRSRRMDQKRACVLLATQSGNYSSKLINLMHSIDRMPQLPCQLKPWRSHDICVSAATIRFQSSGNGFRC